MAKSNKVLSIDITNESITIVEMTASPKKESHVHNVIILETPEDSYEDGVIKEPEKIAGIQAETHHSRGAEKGISRHRRHGGGFYGTGPGA